MNARQTRALIKRVKRKCGTYKEMAKRLSDLHPDETITLNGVYSWITRGKITEGWPEHVEHLDYFEEQER